MSFSLKKCITTIQEDVSENEQQEFYSKIAKTIQASLLEVKSKNRRIQELETQLQENLSEH